MRVACNRTTIFCAVFMLLGSEAALACYPNCPPAPRPRMQSFQTKLVPPSQSGRLVAPNTANSNKNAKKSGNAQNSAHPQ